MSSSKKDLTRIEDLGEFFHDETDEPVEFQEELPEIPLNEVENSFISPDESELNFNVSEEFEAPDFAPEGALETNNQEFETNPFESSPPENPLFVEEDIIEANENKEDKINEDEDDNEIVQTSSDLSSFPVEDEVQSSWEAESSILDHSDNWEEPAPSSPEDFGDLKKFSEASSFSGMATEGNPSFSVLIKNVRYIEDINDILALLKEFDLLVDSEEQVKSRLMRGMLLVPRISEFAAILLAHKLRRYDIDIEIGLSDEIHPSKHLESSETGIVSKLSLYQNQSHHFEFHDVKIDISRVIVSASSTLDGYQIVRYLGIASEHKIIESHILEREDSFEVNQIYDEVAQKLKAHALKTNANAVVGLNYQLTPLASEYGINKYRLTCTANLVWVQKL